MNTIVVDHRARSNSTSGGAVDSVNGQTGVVVLTKSSVGLGNVQNVDQTNPANITQSSSFRFATDAEKTTWNSKVDATYAYSKTQSDAAYEPKNANIQSHIANTSNPHAVTKAQVGLGNTDNTSDVNKPVSTAQQTALDLKADKVNIQVFTSSGTWTKPAGAKFVEVHAISGGGGGGAGRRGAAGTVRNGGGGAAAGSSVMGRFDASLLTSTVTVTIGSGGTGAVSTTVDNTDGATGVDGGATTFGSYLSAPGGKAGKGGTATNGLGGVTSLGSQSPWNYIQFGGANASATGGAGTSPSVQQWISPNSGASGAGISAADAISNGSPGGAITGIINPMINAPGGLAGGVAPANAGNGTNSGSGPYNSFFVGTGGGSSRSSTTTASGNGGDGGLYGGGGAGSGATLNGFATGQGGKGGDGIVVVVAYF